MDFADLIAALSEQTRKQLEHIQTEEATKTALILPFIQALGYNIFDPTEVVPEFTADIGTKKGEKVDYAIFLNGKPIILFECKSVGVDLDHCHASQLYRYFSVTNARIAVLTNGSEYRFYSDLEEANKMDSKPYLVFDLLEPKKGLPEQVKMVTKSSFDLDRIISAAGDLKYTRGIRQVLEKDFDNPSDELVRYLVSQVYSGRFTKNVKAQFGGIVKRAFSEMIRDRINQRLESALAKEQAAEEEEEAQPPEQEDGTASGVVTTDEELEGYRIVRAIVSEVVDPERVTYRDHLSFFNVLLDDTNRKPVCRLRFNTSQKYIGLFDAEKNEERIPINSLPEIYRHGSRIKETVLNYESATDRPANGQP